MALGGSLGPEAWELAIGNRGAEWGSLDWNSRGRSPKRDHPDRERLIQAASGGVGRSGEQASSFELNGRGPGGPTEASPVTYCWSCCRYCRYGREIRWVRTLPAYIIPRTTSTALSAPSHARCSNQRSKPSQTSRLAVANLPNTLACNFTSEMCSRPCPSSHSRRMSWPRSSRPSSSPR